MYRHGGGRAWSSRGRRRPDAHVARINDVANGLAAASLALQVDDDITARQAIDESLRQASGMLTEAVERADARERRHRAGTWAAGLTTAAVAAVTAFAVSFPSSTPSDAPGFVASGEHAAEFADAALLDDVATWIDELAHRGPDEVTTTPLVAHASEGVKRTREAAAPSPAEEAPAPARAGGAEASAVSGGGTAINAATPPSSGGSSAPSPSASSTSSTSGTSGSVSTASEPAAEPETHPGKIKSGRAEPSDNAQPEPGPAPHSNGRGNNA